MDSGGFTELSKHGRWTVPAAEYAERASGFQEEMGNLVWASQQDWMCEPFMIENTGLSIEEHQERTVQNFLDLTAIAPEVPFIPVLQGWEVDDYHHCADLFESAGVDLLAEPIVGLGSVCRRQGTKEAGHIVWSLAARGYKLHGFGFKTTGLKAFGFDLLASSDSMSWSYAARKKKIRLPGCSHKVCNNCLKWALQWRAKLLSGRRDVQQMQLVAS